MLLFLLFAVVLQWFEKYALNEINLPGSLQEIYTVHDGTKIIDRHSIQVYTLNDQLISIKSLLEKKGKESST